MGLAVSLPALVTWNTYMAAWREWDKTGWKTALGWFWSLMIRVCVFALLWWSLTGSSRDWLLALVFVTGAAASSLMLYAPIPMRPLGLVRFIPFFLISSLQGGMDVARRAFSPTMPLQPGLISYTLNLVHPVAKVIFVWVVSLLPGTASVHLEDDILCIHVLDLNLDHPQKLQNLERHVAGLLRAEKKRTQNQT
jgi:multicomponent Na+:H+ antiporter subunit E